MNTKLTKKKLPSIHLPIYPSIHLSSQPAILCFSTGPCRKTKIYLPGDRHILFLWGSQDISITRGITSEFWICSGVSSKWDMSGKPLNGGTQEESEAWIPSADSFQWRKAVALLQETNFLSKLIKWTLIFAWTWT